MKKITNFIINKRHAILIIYIILTIISCILATKVEINSDLTKYLPETSTTRIGTKIMNEEFKNIEMPSTLKIMFKDLKTEEKETILEELKNIKGITNVEYDETEKHNKDGYTLYTINTDAASDSQTAKKIYEEILEKYKDYEINTSGSIKTSNTEILPTWIMITSISCAIIILIIMCDSYLEPFLFLITILIAVILNAGTNIIFDSISEITNSISAILVMALSMDYSIMLINRYRSEKTTEKNDIEAMKNALYHSFQSITSSSLTTIVGLITLIFMSFTIGRDLGLVLAKGVFLSLISIFICLPTLILTFDKWITKTEKKTINIKLKTLGKISYKIKTPITILFIILFIGSVLLKGNLEILYTSPENDKIEEIFGNNNQLAIIYKNDFEEKITNYINNKEQNEKIANIQGYGNTLNYPLKYNDINAKTKELSTEMNIEEYMIKILYYHYYNKEENNTITLEEFTNFILKETQNNEKFQNMITTSQIEKLKYISNPYEIQKERDVQTLARILEIEEDKIEDILTYYNSKTNTLELTLKECVNFIINEVLTDPKYTKIFNEETLVNLKTLETYIDEEYITQELNAQELSSILNISEEDIKLILLLKYSQTDNGLELTLKDFTTQVKNLKENTEYLKEIDITAIEKISIFTDENFITKPLTKQELSNIFGVEIIKEIYNIKNLQDTDTLNVKDVVEIIIEIDKTITILDEKAKEELNIIKQIIENTLNEPQKTYTSIEIAELLKTNQKTTNTLYALIELTSNNAKWTMSISETINIIINTEEITGKIDEEKLKSIKQIDTIMQTTLNNTKLNSQKTSEILGIDKTNIDLLYGLYTTKYINKEISIKKLIDTLETEIINNDNYEEGFSETEKNKITNIKKLMDDSINRRKYTKEEMHTKLNLLTNEIDKKDIELMYIYYGSINNYNEEWTITIEEITNYLNDEIIHDERFTKFIDEDTKENIKQAKEKVKKAKALLVGKNYSRIIINTKYQSESEETYKYIETLKDELQKDWVESYIIGDSSMAYEMDKTFAKEFNFISVLTIISLIIVVGIAFKSFIIPVILVLLIQTAVYLTMGILSITVGSVYFIAILVVQSILMGATIDYAIVYTSYYLENRKTLNVKESILKSYESSIHTIMTSASILIIVTLILGIFAKDITSKICMTISEGTLCSSLLILLVLPGTLAAFDKKITKKIKKYDKIK